MGPRYCESTDKGVDLRYAWGLAADAEDPTLVYASATSGPGRAHSGGFSDAAIYRRVADGRWERVLEGLAAVPYALCADPKAAGTLFAGLEDGTILRSQDSGRGWSEIARVPTGLQAVTT